MAVDHDRSSRARARQLADVVGRDALSRLVLQPVISRWAGAVEPRLDSFDVPARFKQQPAPSCRKTPEAEFDAFLECGVLAHETVRR